MVERSLMYVILRISRSIHGSMAWVLSAASGRGCRRAFITGLVHLPIALGLSTGCVAPKSAVPGVSDDVVAEERLLQQELAVTINRDRRQRLADLSWPLRRAGAELCGDDVAPEFGFEFESLDQYDDELRDAAIRALDLRRAPTVTVVADGGPAHYARVQAGDVLTHVGRYRVPPSEDGIELALDRLRGFVSDPPPFPAVPLRFERLGEPYVQELIPERVCDYPVVLLENDSINAFADGSTVYITNGMMRFSETDQELQVVIAHELAHNLEGHLGDRKKNTAIGGLLGLAGDLLLAAAGVNSEGTLTAVGLAAGATAFSQDVELEADYVAMYILARAGIDTSAAPMFWRRIAVEHTGSIENNHFSSHPSTPERFVRLDAAHEEIEAKLSAGLPLLPNKDEQP